MGSSLSKSNGGSWHWVSWSLNTDWWNRISAWRIWLQGETITKLDQPERWVQHPFLAIGNCLCKGCWGSSWADQMFQGCSLISVSQSYNPIPENLHTHTHTYVCMYVYDYDCKSGIQETISKHLIFILPSHQTFPPQISSKKHFSCCPGGHLQKGAYLWSHGSSWKQ